MSLENVTLITLRGVNYKNEEHRMALDHSSYRLNFGAVLDIQLNSIKDIDTWNYATIYELPKYIHTSHCMFIHHDGYVIDPDLWNDKWLEYDYIGAPFPLPKDDYSYRDEKGNLVRVGNSVSLRSKKLMDLVATRKWKYYFGNCNEDGFITCHNRYWLEEQGCKFAPLEEAIHFSKEHAIDENRNLSTFAFHSIT